jgi:hypothetical protein
VCINRGQMVRGLAVRRRRRVSRSTSPGISEPGFDEWSIGGRHTGFFRKLLG